MNTFAAVSMCIVLGVLAVFQALLVFGAPLGRFAWGGQHRVLPLSLRIGSVISIALYLLIAAIVLSRVEAVSLGVPATFARVAVWVIAAYFLIGIGLNLASKSKGERSVMPAISAVMCVLCIVVAVS